MAHWRPKRWKSEWTAPAGFTRWWCGTCIAAAIACFAAEASHADARPYYLHNHNPFLQVFGLPAPEGGLLTAPGRVQSRLVATIANHADENRQAGEAVVLDGESYLVDTLFRYGVGSRWEIGLDIPYVAHRGGELDDLIEGWHEAFGLDNGNRRRPSNHLTLSYERDGILQMDLRDGSGGLGDVRLTGAWQLLKSADDERSLALRGIVKLPTGNEELLRGSGAADLALSLEGTDTATFASRAVTLYGQLGVLRLGDGDVLPDAQKSTVPFGSVGLSWQWTGNVDLRAQVALQGEYFDSALDEIGGGTANLAVGATARIPRFGIELDLALLEDLVSDTTPDFGLYLSIRRTATGAHL